MTTIIEFNGYDFYKEIWMHMTRIDRPREGHLVSDIDKLRASESAKTAPWYTRISLFLYADLTRNQDRLIRLPWKHGVLGPLKRRLASPAGREQGPPGAPLGRPVPSGVAARHLTTPPA